MMTNGDYWRGAAERRGIPLRTLHQVRAALDLAKLNDADASMARLMLRHSAAPLGFARAVFAANHSQAQREAA